MRSRAGLLPLAAIAAFTAMVVPALAQFSGVTDQFDDMRNSLGFGRARPPMDFTERPPLVVPPSDALPPPGGQVPLGINDPDVNNRRKALTDSRRPVPPSDPGAGVAGLGGRTYLVDPPAGMRDASTLGPDPTFRSAAQGQGRESLAPPPRAAAHGGPRSKPRSRIARDLLGVRTPVRTRISGDRARAACRLAARAAFQGLTPCTTARLHTVAFLGLTPETDGSGVAADTAIVQGKLDNGMDVVVIPDHRAPVCTHMVWYRNGSADDPVGKSGIAHFLEHLMFKGTEKNPAGKFSELVSDLGGQENAFTSNDFTAYFQRIPKEHLAVCMEYEADRMKNLVITDEVVGAPERNVVEEERRMRTDSDPGEILDEAIQAALYTSHPYGKPVIGWAHEIEGLERKDAFNYYERFYTPENAILIVAGDIDPQATIELARQVYGPVPPFGAPPKRVRPQEPRPTTHRQVSLADEKVEQPRYQRLHLVPSYRTGAPGEAEALEVLAFLLGGGQTSVLFKTLVMQDKVAVAAGAALQWAPRSTRRGSFSTRYRCRASASSRSTQRSRLSSHASPRSGSTRRRSPAPRHALSRRRSTLATAR